MIREALGENDFLKNLSPSQMREIIDAMQLKKVASGAYVIREGDSGSHLYVSSQGEYEVIKDGKVLGSLGVGKAFGELAILYNCKRTASVKGKTKKYIQNEDASEASIRVPFFGYRVPFFGY